MKKTRVPPTIRAHHMKVTDLGHRTVRVKLLGERGFRVRRIIPWSLRLRTKGPNLSSGWRRHHAFKVIGDKNGDGFADARAKFRISLKKRVAAGHSHAEVIGILGDRRHRGHHHRAVRAAAASTSSDTDAWTSFSASTALVTTDAAIDYCSIGANGYYARCSWTTSFDKSPVDVDALVGDLNDKLSNAGFDFEILSSDSVQVELFGGAGADGYTCKVCPSNGAAGGSGGDRGYAQSAQSLTALEDLGDGSLYVYVGQDGPSSQNGGSSSMLLGKNILDVTDVQDPAAETFLGIAGGGGGGGETDSVDAVTCQDTVGDCYYNGHSGGDGGVAIATSAASVAGGGQDGHDGKDGKGGSDSTATADEGGQPGVGGFSVDDSGADNGWAGSSTTLDDWSHGSGGDSGKDGGGGGGFGGGGHGNKKNRNYSGGGGGGSWALQDSVVADGTYQVGRDGYDEAGVILTFETSPIS